MKKIIIKYPDDMETGAALEYIAEVVKMGRISADNTCYCYATRFKDGAIVHADTTARGSDSLLIFRQQEAK